MSRSKKDGRYINYYIDRKLCEQVIEYAAQQRQTITAAVEYLLALGLDVAEAERIEMETLRAERARQIAREEEDLEE